MGTTFSAPVYSDGIDRARRDPAQMRQGWAFLEALRRNPPGQWGADRWEQVNHFKDIIYVAGRRVMSLFFAATYAPARRKKPRRGKTTFGPGGRVAKSVGASSREGRDEDYTPIDDCDHPLYRLAARPNPHESMGRVTAKGILQYLLTGVYPAWCVPNSAGRPVELYPLRTPFLYPQPPSPQYPRGAWRVTATGQGWMTNLPFGASAGTVLPGEEVARLLNPHPIIDYDGFSPLTAGGVQLDVLQSIDESRKSAMDSGLNLDAVMLVPGGEQATLDRLSAQMTEKAGGARNHRKFVALATQDFGAGGKTALETLGTAPKDMDYPQGWEQMTKFALALFGVPPAVAGLTPTGGNAELFAARRQFLDQQSGLVGEVGDFYTRCLADPYSSFPGEYVLQVKPQPVDDHEFRETQVKRRIDADLVTYNEARAMDDADPVPGGDVPVSIYLDTLKAKLNPAPAPQPGAPPPGGGKPPPLPGAAPTGGTPPGEELPEAEGTRPPTAGKVAKSSPPEYADPAPYGYCPECRSPGVVAERRIDGNAHCANGHAYPRSKAKYACCMVELSGAAKRKLLSLGSKILDADLGDDGREGEPHVTAYYGLHADGPAQVASAVAGFGPVRYRLGRLAAFRGAESGKDYDVIYAEVESPDIVRLHAKLAELPHTDTHAEYRPHATVAYVKAGLADKYLAECGGPVGEEGVAKTVVFSTATKERSDVPLAVAKAAKAFDESKVKRDHGKFAAKEAHAERSKARESRRDAAGDARAHHDLSAPPVGSGWHEGLSDEQHAAALKQHWDDHATHTRTTRRKLEAAGATEKELAEFDRRAEKARGALEKHHPRLAKLRAKAIAARKAADDHDAMREAIEAEEPEEPTPEDEPPEPDEPEEPVSEFPDLSPEGKPKREDYDSDEGHEDAVAQWESDVNDRDEYEKDRAEWQSDHEDWREECAAVAARNEKAEAAHGKARAAWEKKLEKHDERAEKLTERADDAESDHGEADDEYREEYEDGLGRVGEHVSDVEDRIIADADAEDEADPEPDDEDEDEPVGKAMSALTLSGGGALVPGGGAAVAGKRKKGRKCRPGLGRFLRRELKALGR